jgi:DNA-binding GntR family transcriptional regulator
MFDKIRNADGSLIMWRLVNFRSEKHPATDFEKRMLRLQEDEQVVVVSRSWETQGKVVIREISRIPQVIYGLVEKLETKNRTVDNIALIEGMDISHREERLSIQSAPEDVQKELEVDPSTTIVCLKRMVYSGIRPIEWRIAYCHLKGLQYKVRFSFE